MDNHLDYETVELLRRGPAWRLLRAEHAPLVISFLAQVFVEENVRDIAASALTGRLDDTLYALNQQLGDGTYPRSAKAYLEEWASAEQGWLRKYYPPGSDEPHFDATPALEQVVSFLSGLRARSFVGTESRLNTLFDLLRQMTLGTETDPGRRLEELRRQRDALDREIDRVGRGELDVLDPSAQRDRFQQFSDMARELLADFRQVETNFRELDRSLRVQIASFDGAKGELLDEVLRSRGSITESDQGRSFGAFYDFLLSADRQARFTALLDQVLELPALADADRRLGTIHHDWLAAGERTQATVRLLSAQLRRFLDDRVWLENRRIGEILRGIEAHALQLRDAPGPLPGAELDETAPRIVLPMERRLYAPKRRTAIDSTGLEEGDGDFDSGALYDQVHVDPARLATAVRDALASRPRVGLPSLLADRPLQRGLAELVAYLGLGDEAFSVVFDDRATDELTWKGDDGVVRVATVPRVTFVRAGWAATAGTADTGGTGPAAASEERADG
ncbi:DUF3375 domain-containing protein [Pseudofrankia sp. BMG5.36]|uniref:DUF3375 domain-containing protein n=1 Tax=Pseudofrankia sp. BMG5.36 TaxID=1834512 RepID=UPI0009F3943C|nr:DUF3375 domain-containing protein [Pseudofrankia sp. BMG5.36]